jgi:hypothetical protein
MLCDCAYRANLALPADWRLRGELLLLLRSEFEHHQYSSETRAVRSVAIYFIFHLLPFFFRSRYHKPSTMRSLLPSALLLPALVQSAPLTALKTCKEYTSLSKSPP